MGKGIKTALSAELLLGLALSILPAAFADELAPYEQSIFSHIYLNEPLSKRLERLEISIFGESQSGSDASRQARLLKVLKPIHKAAPKAEPVPSSPDESAPSAMTETAPVSQPPAQQDATDYPTVTALENQVFGRDFIRDDIGSRLDRLEKKVFGHSYPAVALVDRVDKLLMRYPSVNVRAAQDSAIRDLPSDPTQFVGSSRDVYTKVDALEQKLLNGKTFPNKLLTERLDQLEIVAFNNRFSGESVDTRVNRLLKDFEVSGSRQARIPTQERLPYQPAPGQGMTGSLPGSAPARQNIQFGAGFSENSTYRFSPEMMEMLPPDVRAQMGGTGGIRSQGTVVSAPGTVIIERSTTSYPGFQNYGGTPIPYYNYYGPAGNPQVQTRQQTTTLIQPNGNNIVYGYPGALPGTVAPAPTYIGDPALLQELGNLEVSAFGQINTMEPVYIRLGKLESAILGQIFPSYPEAQRLANLKQAYQYQSLGRLLGKGKAGDAGRSAGSLILGVPLTPPPANPAPQ